MPGKLGVPAARGGHHRQGHGRPALCRLLRDLRRTLRSVVLEHHHRVLRYSLVFLPCTGRRSGWCHHHQGSTVPIIWSGFGKILMFILISLFLGYLRGGFLMVLAAWLFRNETPSQVKHWFDRTPLLASGAYSLPMAATTHRRQSASSG
jgi:hypothetical protein